MPPESASVDKSYMRCYRSVEKDLLFTLDLWRSHQIVLQAGSNLAPLFGVSLMSDLKAKGLNSLFSNEIPQVMKAEQEKEVSIQWSDVLRSRNFKAELQKNGRYRVRIDRHQALVEMSAKDYEFIQTGFPRKIIDFRSYPSDVVSEAEAAKLVMAQIAPLEAIAVQCSYIPKPIPALIDGVHRLT
ncbi:hypothetical protein N7448_011330 [Penicillium atrosanguineum]|nr:hypothetical protein N7448_011330 [Penicillium atrosanguineum]